MNNIRRSHPSLPFNPAWMALKTENAPDSKLFSSWQSLARELAKAGFSPHQAEAILRSGWLKAAIRTFSTQKDGHHKGNIVPRYLHREGITPNSEAINKLVCDTFTDVVPNELGVPCYEKKHLLTKETILVPVDTPSCCDPSTETYHSM